MPKGIKGKNAGNCGNVLYLIEILLELRWQVQLTFRECSRNGPRRLPANSGDFEFRGSAEIWRNPGSKYPFPPPPHGEAADPPLPAQFSFSYFARNCDGAAMPHPARPSPCSDSASLEQFAEAVNRLLSPLKGERIAQLAPRSGASAAWRGVCDGAGAEDPSPTSASKQACKPAYPLPFQGRGRSRTRFSPQCNSSPPAPISADFRAESLGDTWVTRCQLCQLRNARRPPLAHSAARG